jgi:hypothetical protein
MAAHLLGCAACRAQGLELAAITAYVRGAALERPANDVLVRRRRRVTGVRIAAVSIAAGVAASALLALSGLQPQTIAKHGVTDVSIRAQQSRRPSARQHLIALLSELNTDPSADTSRLVAL